MRVASCTLVTLSCLAEPFVEKDSIATRGSMPASARAESAAPSAMFASASASGSMLTAQSAKIITPSSPYALFGHSIRKQEETVLMPGLGLDDLQRRAQHIAGGMDRAGDEAVGVARLDHHHAVVHRILDQLGRLLLGHALGLAQLVEQAGVGRALVRSRRVDDLDAVEARAVGGGLDLLRIAQQRQLREALARDDRRRLRVARLLALGQDDVLHVGLGLGLDLIDDCHE